MSSKLTIKCWRCGSKSVTYEQEKLDDGQELPFYKCDGCNTTWYDYQDIAPYYATLRRKIRDLSPVSNVLPTGMRTDRPQ